MLRTTPRCAFVSKVFSPRSTNRYVLSCCDVSNSKHAPPIASERKRLLSLLSAPSAERNPTIDNLIQQLANNSTGTGNDLEPDNSTWNERLYGKWKLLYTTETPILAFLNGSIPFLSTGDIYQLVTPEKLVNTIEFPSIPAVLAVDVNYQIANGGTQRKCSYDFVNTTIAWRDDAKKWFNGDRSGGWKAGWAIGNGFFRTIWLDQTLRIDRDTSGEGRDWINCYVYDGPVNKCTAGNKN